MRAKRSKQYRKLMEQYSQTFGFREPYQVLVDAEMVRDSCRFKMDLAAGLERTVHGKVKPMITQCEIRKLYAQKNEPLGNEAIDVAKAFERRRCGHHPEDYPEPLGTEECLQSVVDPKSTGQNKHRYVVASQDQSVRSTLRAVRGVPQIYIKKSVMLLERMADDSAHARMREEKLKFRAELKSSQLGKRKRAGDDEDEDEDDEDSGADGDKVKDAAPPSEDMANSKKGKARGKGPKGPNPLSVKRPKAKRVEPATSKKPSSEEQEQETEEKSDAPAKRKRRRKGKTQTEGTNGTLPDGDAVLVDAD